jgi:hypothetical protein
LNTCEGCQHWGSEEIGWQDAVLPRWSKWNQLPAEKQEVYEQHNRESKVCTKVNEGWMWEGDASDLPLATVWDGSEFAASLHTHKSFGCVLWESR